jgi:large subunit ribosomal protein L35
LNPWPCLKINIADCFDNWNKIITFANFFEPEKGKKGDNINLFKLSKMPKIKTNSGAKKRFALTGTGKIKRKHAYKSHILTKKTKKQKRNLTHTGLVHKADEKNVKTLLGL